jgi:ubiquinone/menaquinone biosynthesis C-methylase UbiE
MNPQTISGRGGQDRFGRWAPQYENGEVMSRLLSDLQIRAAALLHLVADDRFLDVGCATGAAVRAASATVERALGVDSSAAMILQARALAAALPRAAFVAADAQQLPFPSATFSAILCSTALRHFPDATRSAAEMVRVLTPAGRIVLADFPVRGEQRGRGWWRKQQPPSAPPHCAGPAQAVAATETIVTELIRCATALGPYEIVSAVKSHDWQTTGSGSRRRLRHALQRH